MRINTRYLRCDFGTCFDALLLQWIQQLNELTVAPTRYRQNELQRMPTGQFQLPFPSNLSMHLSRASVFLRRLDPEYLVPPAVATGGETTSSLRNRFKSASLLP
jgi:hypothetical protein